LTVGVGTPLARPAAFAGDGHQPAMLRYATIVHTGR
jgi:hypothetical protein